MHLDVHLDEIVPADCALALLSRSDPADPESAWLGLFHNDAGERIYFDVPALEPGIGNLVAMITNGAVRVGSRVLGVVAAMFLFWLYGEIMLFLYGRCWLSGEIMRWLYPIFLLMILRALFALML